MGQCPEIQTQAGYKVWYAVVTDHTVVKAETLPSHLSVQVAEHHALIEACKISAGHTATIYTDSRYA